MTSADVHDSEAEPMLGSLFSEIAIRLVDEGVPVRAIARALMCDKDALRVTLSQAISQGQLLNVTRDDWPPGTARQSRAPDHGSAVSNDRLPDICIRMFKLTPHEAKLMAALLKRNEASKELLLELIYGPTEDLPEIKIIDVFVCKLRKKLKLFGVEVHTLWGRGYFMDTDTRRRLLAEIEAFDAPPRVEDAMLQRVPEAQDIASAFTPDWVPDI